jgi:hypothetical protein
MVLAAGYFTMTYWLFRGKVPDEAGYGHQRREYPAVDSVCASNGVTPVTCNPQFH